MLAFINSYPNLWFPQAGGKANSSWGKCTYSFLWWKQETRATGEAAKEGGEKAVGGGEGGGGVEEEALVAEACGIALPAWVEGFGVGPKRMVVHSKAPGGISALSNIRTDTEERWLLPTIKTHVWRQWSCNRIDKRGRTQGEEQDKPESLTGSGGLKPMGWQKKGFGCQ